MKIQDWLGESNQLGIDIWQKKYQQMGESLDEWFDRISGGNKAIPAIDCRKKVPFRRANPLKSRYGEAWP